MVHEAPTGGPKRQPTALTGTHPTRPAGTHLPFGSQRDGHNPLLRPKCGQAYGEGALLTQRWISHHVNLGGTVSHGFSGRPARNVFVGRENETAVLRAAWRSATHGSAQIIAIEGDPGSPRRDAEAALGGQGSPPADT